MSPLLLLGLALARNAAARRPPGHRLPAGPEDYRIAVADPVCRARIGSILSAFFTGFEGGLRRPRACGGSIEDLFRPFLEEGRAMGLAARSSLAFRGLERAASGEPGAGEDPFVFLRHVGIGFWLGFRHGRRADRVEAASRRFGKYAELVLDGYGFKLGFFDAAGDPEALRALLRTDGPAGSLPEAAGAAFANGLGRSLWFFRMDDPRRAFADARGLGAAGPAVLGGLGLAAAFTFPDDLGRAYSAAGELPPGERAHFLKGIRIALYVRNGNHPRYLESCLARLPAPLRERALFDLALASRVGAEARSRADFIPRVHRGCLEPPG
jgi:hypothetical protein